MTVALLESLERTEIMIWQMLTRATVPLGYKFISLHDPKRNSRLLRDCSFASRGGGRYLSESTSHTGLETISSGTGQHFVNSDDVVWMASHSHVESILTTNLRKVFVGANTTGFKGFGGQLLILVGNQMHAERELVHTSLLTTQIKDTDLKDQHR